MQLYKDLPDLVKEFLVAHGVAAFATISPDNSPQVAFLFYTTDNKVKKIYMSSRKKSNKIRNILKNPRSALGITDISNLTTLQMEGISNIINDNKITPDLLEKFSQASERENTYSFQPTMKLTGGPLLVIEFSIKQFRYSNFLYRKAKFIEGRLAK